MKALLRPIVPKEVRTIKRVYELLRDDVSEEGISCMVCGKGDGDASQCACCLCVAHAACTEAVPSEKSHPLELLRPP